MSKVCYRNGKIKWSNWFSQINIFKINNYVAYYKFVKKKIKLNLLHSSKIHISYWTLLHDRKKYVHYWEKFRLPLCIVLLKIPKINWTQYIGLNVQYRIKYVRNSYRCFVKFANSSAFSTFKMHSKYCNLLFIETHLTTL